MTGRRCLALRHVAFEDLGAFHVPVEAAGYAVEIVDAPTADLAAIGPLAPDLLVLLGGPIGIGQRATYPFLDAEIDIARARLDADRPILGLCLGAQVMAAALGAEVRPGRPEIGVGPIALTEEGHASVLRHLGAGPVLHWHGDAMTLPAGADHLARSGPTEVQAWSRGPTALALQFHPEADPAAIEHWLVGHASEIVTTGHDAGTIRAAVARDGAAIAARGRAMIEEWLVQLP